MCCVCVRARAHGALFYGRSAGKRHAWMCVHVLPSARLCYAAWHVCRQPRLAAVVGRLGPPPDGFSLGGWEVPALQCMAAAPDLLVGGGRVGGGGGVATGGAGGAGSGAAAGGWEGGGGEHVFFIHPASDASIQCLPSSSIVASQQEHPTQAKTKPLGEMPVEPGAELLRITAAACLKWEAASRPTAAGLARQFGLQVTVGKHRPLPAPTHVRTARTGDVAAAADAAEEPAGTVPIPDTVGELASSGTAELASPAGTGRCNEAKAQVPHPSVGKAADDDAQGPGSSAGKTADDDAQRSEQRDSPAVMPSSMQCKRPGCASPVIKKPPRLGYCWQHMDFAFPAEFQVAKAFAQGGILQWLFPCDLVALCLFAGDPRTSLLTETFVSFLKVPGAVARFLAEAPARGAWTASSLQRAVQAASVSEDRSPAEAAAGRQVHRQRMGACMGPTRLHTLIWSKGRKELERFLENVQQAAKQVPRFALDPEAAVKHIQKYKVWLQTFCSFLRAGGNTGNASEEGYIYKHLLRKHLLLRTWQQSRSGRMDPTGQEIMQELSTLSTASWLKKDTSTARVLELMPDQGGCLTKLPYCVRPGHAAHKCGGVDLLMLSCWCCLAHDLLSNLPAGWTASGLIEYIGSSATHLVGLARAHQSLHIDAGVPIAPCMLNLMKEAVWQQHAGFEVAAEDAANSGPRGPPLKRRRRAKLPPP